MANTYYNPTGAPVAQARGSSGSERAEFASIGSAFDKMPTITQLLTNSSSMGIDSGSVNAYLVTVAAGVVALTDGMEVVFKAANTATGAATINVNTLGLKSIVRPDGSTLQAGDIAAGQYIAMRYSTAMGAFQITSGVSAANTAAAVALALSQPLYLTGIITAGTVNITGTDALLIPVGTTVQRPTGANGKIRYNTVLQAYEGYNGTAWASLGGGATGSPANPGFYENASVVSGSYTITAGKNAMSAGPITVADAVTVTIPDGSVWTIV